MVLPQTYLVTLLLLILSMICWGSWANTLKMTGKWRFELFYFDYSFGVMIAAAIAALTFGSLGYDGFTFQDDVYQTGKRNLFFGALAGMMFNLGNMMLVGAISVAGMAVAFPIGVGMALVIGVIWTYILRPAGSPIFLFGGSALVVAAIVVCAMAYRTYARTKLEEQAKAGLLKTSMPVVPKRALVLSMIAGLLMGSFYPLVEIARTREPGAGPYTIGFAFAVGILLSTLPYNLFFMNLPVQGEPVEIRDYFLKGRWSWHALGVLGGMIWCTGTMANFVASSAEVGALAHVGPAVSYALGQGATMISALWGILVWKEFAGADVRVKALLAMMFALFLIGLTLVSIAPLQA